MIICIDKYQPHTPERRNAYLADITYGTNNEFGFDYLRDNMVRSPEEMVQRKLHFAMVDEVDSVLIDDARTPLIISGPIPKGDEQEFYELKPRIAKIVEAQNRVFIQAFNEAKKLIEAGKDGPEDGGRWLYVAQRGAPKNRSIIKYLSETGKKQILTKAENTYIAEQQRRMPEIDQELFFSIDEKNNSVELTDKGIELITGAGEDAHFFVIPDVGALVADIEKMEADAPTKLSKKDEILRDFSIKSERIHTVNQLLKAYTMFEKDVEYVVMDSKVKIVDEQTGRILDGRRYSDGLHQAIEAKENVKVEAATQTYATITLQNYFIMFHKLAGMTGTAETEAGEFWSIYELDVVTIPTNQKIIRNDKTDLIYKTQRSKYKAVIEEIEKLVAIGRPVLVGTVSVEDSELLSRMLTMKKVKHNVLNAKQHQREAQIVAEAGWEGNVTIATNMAGRGTDIKLSAVVKANGGLAIIGTERHESRRVDRQLRGRAGRQGDPGSSQFFVSMEDNLMRLFGSDRAVKLMDKMGGYGEDEVLESSMLSGFIENAQKKVEENNFGIRKRLLEYDDVMNVQRTRIYQKRQHALQGLRLSADIDEMIDGVCENIINTSLDGKDYDEFKLEVIKQLSFETEINEAEFKKGNANKLTDILYHEAVAFYNRKRTNVNEAVMNFIINLKQERGDAIQSVMVPFTDGRHTFQGNVNVEKAISTKGKEVSLSVEKAVVLGYLDDAWKEHLRMMEDLKQAVQTAHLEQKDPLQIYKKEAYTMLENTVGELNSEILGFLFKAGLPTQDDEGVAKQQAEARKKIEFEKEQLKKITTSRDEHEENQKSAPIKVDKKVGRNEPCPCGSGKKFKSCHGTDEA
jgi:preprotein translocase subunit SecA